MEIDLRDYMSDKERELYDALLECARQRREREKEEREGAMFLLVNVCEQLDEAEQIEKRMNEFSSVYGETIPEWLQILYDYMAHFGKKKKWILLRTLLGSVAWKSRIPVMMPGRMPEAGEIYVYGT